MKIGLYFGSFNPIHIGHLIVASFIVQNTEAEQVWFVVSPQNPLKPSSTLLNEYHRLHLVQLAVEDDPLLKWSDIEFKLPRPSYTADTLAYISEKYPQHHFSIVVGSDSYSNMAKWKNTEYINTNYPIYIYQRPGFDCTPTSPSHVLLKPPLLEISATMIRDTLKSGKSIRYLVPDKVLQEIERSHYYR